MMANTNIKLLKSLLQAKNLLIFAQPALCEVKKNEFSIGLSRNLNKNM